MCFSSLDHLEGAQGQVLRELKCESSCPHSLVSALLALCRGFLSGLMVKKGMVNPLG